MAPTTGSATSLSFIQTGAAGMGKPVNLSSLSRRKLLGRIAQATAAVSLGSTALLESAAAAGADDGPTSDHQRVQQAYKIRHQAALYQKNLPMPRHATNGDDQLYPHRIGSYSKGMPHNAVGEVEPTAYEALLRALDSGVPAAFEDIPLGGAIRQTNPQAAFAFELEGADSHHLGLLPSPAFSSAQTAGEMVELYWQALTRDVPFVEYDAHPQTLEATKDLSQLSDFRGPHFGGRVTPATLFRGQTPGDLKDPYLSQFLWKPIPYGATTIPQRYRTTLPGDDHLTSYSEWFNIQNGMVPSGTNVFDSAPRYLRNGRDLGEYVHRDFTYQAFLSACLILLGMRAPFARNNPYRTSQTQTGFSTFGGPHILDLVARVANCALKAAWYQKWSIHRRLRPEEFAGRLHHHKSGATKYPIHPDVLNSPALGRVFDRYGSYLLPMAYPEGCPTHPAYPAGHAAIAGACATVLKAFFDESFVIPDPQEASADGLSLTLYTGPELTVGGELNKLASNIAVGRNAAGVHWRSDATEGLRLGEAVALSVLADLKNCVTEGFGGFSLTKFDGTRTRI